MRMIDELRARTNCYTKKFYFTRSEAHDLLDEIESLEIRYAQARALLTEVIRADR